MATPMVQVNVRIEQELHARLELTCRNTGKSQSEVVRIALDAALDRKAKRNGERGKA